VIVTDDQPEFLIVTSVLYDRIIWPESELDEGNVCNSGNEHSNDYARDQGNPMSPQGVALHDLNIIVPLGSGFLGRPAHTPTGGCEFGDELKKSCASRVDQSPSRTQCRD
jgi:hypothetical protein